MYNFTCHYCFGNFKESSNVPIFEGKTCCRECQEKEMKRRNELERKEEAFEKKLDVLIERNEENLKQLNFLIEYLKSFDKKEEEKNEEN